MQNKQDKKVYGIVEYEWGQLFSFEVYDTHQLAKKELKKIPAKERKIWYVQEIDLVEEKKND